MATPAHTDAQRPPGPPASGEEGGAREGRARPTTATGVVAQQIDKLMGRVDKPIALPSAAKVAPLNPAKIKDTKNIQGSSAGAGSGEFHVYRAVRRKEYSRMARIDAAAQAAIEAQDFAAAKAKRAREDAERTAKKRAKRLRKKGKAGAGAGPAGGDTPGAPEDGSGGDDGAEGEAAEPARKGYGQVPDAIRVRDGSGSAEALPALPLPATPDAPPAPPRSVPHNLRIIDEDDS